MTDAAPFVMDALERCSNLLEALRARDALEKPAPTLDEQQLLAMAQLIGPVLAALHACGTCVEVLGLAAGISAEEIQAIRRDALTGEVIAPEDVTEILAPAAALSQALTLKELVVGDLALIAALAVA